MGSRTQLLVMSGAHLAVSTSRMVVLELGQTAEDCVKLGGAFTPSVRAPGTLSAAERFNSWLWMVLIRPST